MGKSSHSWALIFSLYLWHVIGLVAMNARYSVAIRDLWPGSLTVDSVVAEIDVSYRTLPEDAMLPVVIMEMANKPRKKF